LEALLSGIPKIKIEIRHRRISGLAHGLDILDDGGTGKNHQSSLTTTAKLPRTRGRFFQIQLQLQDTIRGYRVGDGTRRTFSVDPKKRSF
jgi:hypothetical protein